MKIPPEKLAAEAEATGSRPDVLEKFNITNRMTQAIARIERARLTLHRSGLGHVCDNLATRIASFQTIREAI